MRVIAVAGYGLSPSGDRDNDEAGLRLVGLVAFNDPVRGRHCGAGRLRGAGIRVIMIWRPPDHHAVAEA
jgi:magnesium-transporting ATPase (P-type)